MLKPEVDFALNWWDGAKYIVGNPRQAMQDLSDFNTYAIENTRNAVFKPLNDWNNAENQKSSEVTAGSLLRNLFVGVVGNVVGDGLILGTFDAALHPVRTYKGIETIMGLAQGLEPENIEFIDSLMKKGSEEWEKFKSDDPNTQFRKGFESLANLALIFAPASKAGAVSKVSTISKIEKSAVVAEDLAKIGKTAEMGNLSREPLKLGIQFFGGEADDVARGAGEINEQLMLPARGESSDSINFNGKTVSRDNSLFDPNFIDKQGRTNIQRMEEDLAPIGHDGKSVNIHHIDQTNSGPVMEISATRHQQEYNILHQNIGQLPSQIDRNSFNLWRNDYWNWRSNDFK